MPDSGSTGDREADFRSFVTARGSALVRTATLLGAGDEQLAEDLVQTALTRLYVAWRSGVVAWPDSCAEWPSGHWFVCACQARIDP